MPRKPESKAGTWGWIGLAAYVVAWDLAAPESLTHAFERGRTHEIGKVAVLGATAVTVAHLIGNIIPREYDPFYLALELHNERRVENDT